MKTKSMKQVRGMDMSVPGARERWRQLLSWVTADLALFIPGLGIWRVPKSWKPNGIEERVETRFLRQLMSAQTAEAICDACCPRMLIKELAVQVPGQDFGALELEDAFRRLASSFNLTPEEAYNARRIADDLDTPTCVITGADTASTACAMKFNIIRHAVQTARRLREADNAVEIAQLAARRAIAAERAEREVSAPAQATPGGTKRQRGILSKKERDAKRRAGSAKGAVQNKHDRAILKREYLKLCRKHADRRKDGWMGKSWCASEVARHAGWMKQDDNIYGLNHTYPKLSNDQIKGIAGEKSGK